MSSAVAALLGALLGGSVTLVVSILNAKFQAKRDTTSWERENKRNAYLSATGPLLRVRSRRKRMAARCVDELPAGDELTKHLNDVDEAQHGLSLLAVYCGEDQRTAVEKAIKQFDDLADEIREKPGVERLNSLSDGIHEVWVAVVAAERNDIGAGSASAPDDQRHGRETSEQS
jgi:hypothetical protein